MKTKTLLIGFIILIGVGAYLVLDFYQNAIRPLDVSIDHLKEIQTASDPVIIQNYLFAIKEYLPKEGNPVWIYPTETTNFSKMQHDLDEVIMIVEKISYIPKDSSAYHAGILNIGESTDILTDNIKDAKPYLYVSIPSFFFNLIWMIGIWGLHETLIRKMY